MCEPCTMTISRLLLLLLCCFPLGSCLTAPRTRELTTTEMLKYNLQGVLNEARICPTVFDEKLNQPVISGRCEIVSCEIIFDKTRCTAVPE